jgi:hypothetical protein
LGLSMGQVDGDQCVHNTRLQTQLVHQIIKAAMLTAASKLRASLSYLVAIRRQSLSLQNIRSIRFRSLQALESNGYVRFRVGLFGITGMVPR